MPNFASQFDMKLAPRKQCCRKYSDGGLPSGVTQRDAVGTVEEPVHVGHHLHRPVHPLLGQHQLEAGMPGEDAAEDHHPGPAAGAPCGLHHVHRLGARTLVRVVLSPAAVGVERESRSPRTPAHSGSHDGIVEHREVAARRRQVDALQPVLGRPLHLTDARLGIGDRDVGDADVTLGRLGDEVGQPPVVDAHADRLEVVVAGVAPGDEPRRRERDRLAVQAAVEDDAGGDAGPVHVGHPGRAVLQPGHQARLVAPLEERAVELVGVAEAGDLAELVGLVVAQLGAGASPSSRSRRRRSTPRSTARREARPPASLPRTGRTRRGTSPRSRGGAAPSRTGRRGRPWTPRCSARRRRSRPETWRPSLVGVTVARVWH